MLDLVRLVSYVVCFARFASMWCLLRIGVHGWLGGDGEHGRRGRQPLHPRTEQSRAYSIACVLLVALSYAKCWGHRLRENSTAATSLRKSAQLQPVALFSSCPLALVSGAPEHNQHNLQHRSSANSRSSSWRPRDSRDYMYLLLSPALLSIETPQ